MRICGGDHAVDGRDGRGDRLFHQHVHAARQRLAGHGLVELDPDREADEREVRDRIVHGRRVREDAHAARFKHGDFLRGFLRGSHHDGGPVDFASVLQADEVADIHGGEPADADDGCFGKRHGRETAG